MYVCVCRAVTDREITACASLGVTSLEALGDTLGVGMNCGRCRETAARLLAHCHSRAASASSGTASCASVPAD